MWRVIQETLRSSNACDAHRWWAHGLAQIQDIGKMFLVGRAHGLHAAWQPTRCAHGALSLVGPPLVGVCTCTTYSRLRASLLDPCAAVSRDMSSSKLPSRYYTVFRGFVCQETIKFYGIVARPIDGTRKTLALSGGFCRTVPRKDFHLQAHTHAQNIVPYMSFGSSSAQWSPATRRETRGAHKTLALFGAQLGGAHIGSHVLQFIYNLHSCRMRHGSTHFSRSAVAKTN